MKITIDRFEGKYAVCETEDKKMMDIERSKLPNEAKEGDILFMAPSGDFKIDINETSKRKKSIDRLMKDLWN